LTQVTIISGKSKGEILPMPRTIPMNPTDMPFEFKRLRSFSEALQRTPDNS
jgi:16S rRNA G966 N2-methylase RsmD